MQAKAGPNMVLRLMLGLSGPGGDGVATLCVGGDGPDRCLLCVWQDLLIPDVFAQAHCSAPVALG